MGSLAEYFFYDIIYYIIKWLVYSIVWIMNMYFDYYDSYFVDKTNENSDIDSLFFVSQLIITYYVDTLQKFHIKIFSQGSHIRSDKMINIHLLSS